MRKFAAPAAEAAGHIASLEALLDGARTPVYALDERRRIVYCNLALAEWLGLSRDQILGRPVEFHSEPSAVNADVDQARGRPASLPPLTDLCPPPAVFAGHAAGSMVACVGRSGRLTHRHARFFPLAPPSEKSSASAAGNGAKSGGINGTACRATVAILDVHDVPPAELARELSHDPSADELHRALRRFRRDQATAHAASSLLGDSPPMRKIRAQVAAAASSGANVLVSGPPGSGRAQVARAIHYAGRSEQVGQLLPVDCRVATDDLIRRTLNSLAEDRGVRAYTLLLVEADQLPGERAAQVVEAYCSGRIAARLIATVDRAAAISKADSRHAGQDRPPGQVPAADGFESDPDEVVFAPPSGVDSRLADLVSTITIHVPSVKERLEDLPLLVQAEIEACNQGNHKQIGRATGEAIDLLALHAWPGELDELKRVVAAAHAACLGHEITPRDLPPTIHHAARAATIPVRRQESIVLDDFLAGIERELVTRALAESGGNKAEAARILGMTRPRLYRRLVHLGMEETSDETTSE